MKKGVLILFLSGALITQGQQTLQEIRSENVLKENREQLKKILMETTIRSCNEQPLSKENQDEFASACRAITQFQLTGPKIISILDKMFLKYFTLSYDSKRSLLETAYSLFPKEFKNTISSITGFEKDPKLFAICELYMYRLDPTEKNANFLIELIEKKFPYSSNIEFTSELSNYLHYNELFKKDSIPPVKDLFEYQQVLNTKIIYSFQRWNRDYPGLAVIQNADGNFVKDSSGKLETIIQLARAGSNLPYFITNGNTPQGVFSIQGTAVSKLPFIGPTPNIQLQMPLEDSLSLYFHTGFDSIKSTLDNYKELLPPSWRSHDPILEAYTAGKNERKEIIAHGTTIAPIYFQGKSYAPISPSQGCLTAKEIWDENSGKLISSEQWKLYNAFISTPGDKGYLIVINLDNKNLPVTRQEVEKLLKGFF